VIALIFATFIDLVLLHGPNGQRVFVNPHEVTSLREPLGNDLKHFARGTHCVIGMVNGTFIPVKEDCDAVHNLIHK
jgi:uncharacterized protein YlzI (FlbEa/FlbD family)